MNNNTSAISMEELQARKIKLTEQLKFAEATEASITRFSLLKEVAIVELAILGYKVKLELE